MLKQYAVWLRGHCFSRRDNGARGGVLIGAVAAMVVMGALGAGMVSMLGTAALHEVRANHGERAFYLAESGFRFAVSTSREGGRAALEALPLNKPFNNIPGGGHFTIIGRTIRDDATFRVAATPQQPVTINKGGNLTITEVTTGYLPPRNGLFQIAGKFYRYLKFDSASNTLENLVGHGHQVFPVHFVDEFSATVRGNVELKLRGAFPGDGDLNVFRTVTYYWPLSGGAGTGGALSTFDPADFPGGQRPDYAITPVAGAHFRPTSSSRVVTRHYIHPQGGTYMRTDLIVEGRDSLGRNNDLGQIRYHYVPFKHNAANLGMWQAWLRNNHLLSYDVQVKVATGPQLDYAGMGFMFRAKKQGSGQNVFYSGYGISFMRYNWPVSKNDDRDFIPPAVKPTNVAGGHEPNSLLLVLWEQTGQSTWQWLAYKNLETLNPPTFVRGRQYNGDGYFIHDDSTLMIRVVEKWQEGIRTNDIQLFFGDARWSHADQHGRTQDNVADNVREKRFGYHQRLSPSAGEELWRWPSLPNISATHWHNIANDNDSDWFSAVAWDRVNPGSTATQRHDEAGIASIIRDAGHTSAGFTNNQVKRPELVLHTFGNTCEVYNSPGCGPVHFNDLAVRLLRGEGSGAGIPFIAPIME